MSSPSAVVLVGFGGPEGPDDVLPFLRNVTRGRDVPDERLAEVAEQYARFGGVSPINEQNRALRDALSAELGRRNRAVPIYWGNRNWEPFLRSVMAEVANDGHRSVVALATSAYSSYSSCRQYRDDLAAACEPLGADAPEWVKVRPFWNHPGFIEAVADRVRDALGRLETGRADRTRFVFTAHSIPVAMASTCDYEAQLRDAMALVLERLPGDEPPDADLVFQSCSGPPQVPWLEPDVVDHLDTLTSAGVDAVVVVPIGFISDHMEVKFDLDTQAAAAAAELGISMVRAGTAGTHPAFVEGLADLVDEHLVGATPVVLGPLGPRPSRCVEGCCPAPRRPPR